MYNYSSVEIAERIKKHMRKNKISVHFGMQYIRVQRNDPKPIRVHQQKNAIHIRH